MKRSCLFLMTSFLLIFTSCHDDSFVLNDDDNLEVDRFYTLKKVGEESLTERFNEIKQLTFSSMKQLSSTTFENSDIYEVSLDSNTKALMVNEDNFDLNNPSNFAFAIPINENEEFLEPFIVQTIIITDNLRQLNYYTTALDLIFSVELDITLENMNFVNLATDSNKGKGKDCGQIVANCLSDAYSNHGWVSVWAVVQTGFIPATAVALAAACYLKLC